MDDIAVPAPTARPGAKADAAAALTVVVWGTYDLSKPRTRMCLASLRQACGSVIEVHHDVWAGVEDKSQLRGGRRLVALLRWLLAYPVLIWRYLRAPRHDVAVVLYMGHVDVLVLRPWAWLRRVPVVWDVMLTMHETLVQDRGLVSDRGVGNWLVDLWDRLALSAANRPVMLTAARRDLLAGRLGLDPARIGVAWLAAETAVFPPVPPRPPAAPDRLRILFYAQFTPMHGLDRVIEAAGLVADLPCEWRFIGTGQEGRRLQRWIETQRPAHVTWLEWVPYEALIDELAGCDVCLGLFGDSPKAATAVPNKAVQVLAAGRGLVTRDTAAMRELLHDGPGRPGIYLVPDGSAAGIAAALRQAWAERDLLRAGPLHADLTERFSPEGCGRQFVAAVAGVAAAAR